MSKLAAVDVNLAAGEPVKGRGSKRGRGDATPSKAEKEAAATLEEKDLPKLLSFLGKEETKSREQAKGLLNNGLIDQAQAYASLEERLDSYSTYAEALEAGFVKEVRDTHRATYRMGVKLEAWINTFTPPLAAGGNAGVSGEVQDGIFSHVHSLVSCCTEAIHRALAFEKEYVTQRVKCDKPEHEPTWARFESVIDANMLHDLTKSIVAARNDILTIANSVANNLSHLKPAAEQEQATAMAMY